MVIFFNPSKHFRKAVAFGKLELCRTVVLGRGHFQEFRPRFSFCHMCHVARYGHFTLKHLKLPVVNKTLTNLFRKLIKKLNV